MSMKKTEIAAEIMDTLECEKDFIRHLDATGMIDKIADALNDGDRAEAQAVMKEVFAEWSDWGEDEFPPEPEEEFVDPEEEERLYAEYCAQQGDEE